MSEFSISRNRFGSISFSGGAGTLIAATQVFKNREIWGIERFILNFSQRNQYEFDFVPTQGFEEGIRRSLHQYLRAAKKFGYGDIIHVEAGLVNVESFKLTMPDNYWERFSPPIFENVVFKKTIIDINDSDSINDALVEIFSTIFDSAGMERPENLHGFPPTTNQ